MVRAGSLRLSGRGGICDGLAKELSQPAVRESHKCVLRKPLARAWLMGYVPIPGAGFGVPSLSDLSPFQKVTHTLRGMSLAGVVEDLIALQHLVEQEADVARRRSLDAVRRHVAERDQGAKIAEAARVLAVSAPTVRAWTEAGALHVIPGARPVLVDVMSLAAAKQVLDELRRHTDDRQLLADVLRVLRDRGDRGGDDVQSAPDDLPEGRVRRLNRQGLDELLPPRKTKRSTSRRSSPSSTRCSSRSGT